MKSASTSRSAFLLLVIALFINSTFVLAQQVTLKDALSNNATPILYLGIDFTKTKVINDLTANPNDIHDRQFAGINDVVIYETKKYDIAKALRKTSIDHDLELVAARNQKINPSDILSTNNDDFRRLKESDIVSLVQGFDFGKHKGVGLLFITEAISKTEKATSIWVTFIDMNTKKVLLTERMEGKVGGFGFRNYVASSYKKVIDEIDDKKFKQWQAR
ncbi:MAG: hypothetical protein JST58_10170 [Bacteroidetes bacterium]|nr:hypothetical protein [Bacteroidota bacterium]